MRGRGFTVSLFAAVAMLSGACGSAEIGEGPAGAGGPASPDAAALPDAARAADAAVDAALACDQGDVQATDPATGTCYMLFENAANWQSAEAACAALGGQLAIIDDADTQAVVGALASQLDPLTPDAWLGGSDGTVEGTWRWSGNDSIFYQGAAPVLYTNFRDGEPNDSGPNCIPIGEDCLVIEGDGDGRAWDDRCCARQQPYICQR